MSFVEKFFLMILCKVILWNEKCTKLLKCRKRKSNCNKCSMIILKLQRTWAKTVMAAFLRFLRPSRMLHSSIFGKQTPVYPLFIIVHKGTLSVVLHQVPLLKMSWTNGSADFVSTNWRLNQGNAAQIDVYHANYFVFLVSCMQWWCKSNSKVDYTLERWPKVNDLFDCALEWRVILKTDEPLVEMTTGILYLPTSKKDVYLPRCTLPKPSGIIHDDPISEQARGFYEPLSNRQIGKIDAKCWRVSNCI